MTTYPAGSVAAKVRRLPPAVRRLALLLVLLALPALILGQAWRTPEGVLSLLAFGEFFAPRQLPLTRRL
jgi:hypothetical protein